VHTLLDFRFRRNERKLIFDIRLMQRIIEPRGRTMTSAFSPTTSPAAIASTEEAETLIVRYLQVMEALVEVVQQETELVRAGRLSAAAKLAQPKADLTRLYIADTLSLRTSQAQLTHLLPSEQLELLRQRHDSFRALLQINLTVLATARAVSEGIVRGVSGELARKSAPQTYGATGRTLAPPKSAGQPLAISRML
jgi:hypothetical protein